MGLFKRSAKKQHRTLATYKGLTTYKGSTRLHVVGESYRQDALKKAIGACGREVNAILVPEPQNKHDPNAIGIWVICQGSEEQVGYLSREDAAEYIEGLNALMRQHRTRIGLNAKIIGGEVGKPSLGIILLHKPSDFGIEEWEDEDEEEWEDEDEPEWSRKLPDDPIKAIPHLRKYLNSEQDPIERHYIYDMLESILYRSRSVFDSALREYEEVCRSHDAEMIRILPKLVKEIGKVPFLGTYKQMAIMKQKQHDWEDALRWAKRGIELYSSNPGTESYIADLQKRSEKYEAKLASVA